MTARKAEWDPEKAAAYWINRASRQLLRRHESRLRPLGFGMGHLPVLLALEQHKQLSQKELTALARVEQPTMAEMLARMERDGIVEREPNPADKRGSLFSLSRSARTRLPEAKAELERGESEASHGLNKQEKAQLLELLRRVVENLETTQDG